MPSQTSSRFPGVTGRGPHRATSSTLRLALVICLLTAARVAPAGAAQSSPTQAPAASTAPESTADSTTTKQAKPKPLNQQGEINLIRGLSSEIAVAKLALPRGKHGITLDAQGRIDQAKVRQELKENGAAINPGTPVKITKITFRENHLVFEINGGGKAGKHWYQHIEVGMGTSTQPIAPTDPNQTLAYGSYITLRFPGHVPNLTVDQAKLLLANALDFERHSPTVLYSPTIPPQFKAAIKNHQVVVGMDHDAVLSAKGPPDRKVREDQPDGSQKEDWIYGLPPHVLFVTFNGDSVVSVRQY